MGGSECEVVGQVERRSDSVERGRDYEAVSQLGNGRLRLQIEPGVG